MKTNRRKNNTKKGNEGKSNVLMIVVPLLVLLIVGWGTYKLFIDTPPPPPSLPFVPYEPVEPSKGEIKATIFFDNSSSMKGYANANQNVYLDVLSDLRGFYPNTDAVIGNEKVLGGELIDRIRLHQIDYSNESLLYHDIDLIASKVQKELDDSLRKTLPLCFYLTDGIMSGSDEQIKRDSEYNKIHAQDLQNQICAVLSDKDSIGISVYQFKSHFVGEYWAYDNEHHPLNAMRYFYVMAIGSRSVLANFKQKVDSINSSRTEVFSKFIPEAQWHAIDKHVVNTNLLVGPHGAVNYDGQAYTYKPKVINSQGGFLTFNLDTKVFRNQYIEDMDTLANNAIIEIDGRMINDVNVLWDEKAHAFTFKVPIVLLAKENIVRLTVPRLKYKWIYQSSTPDDKYMFSIPDLRTFLYDKFMQGIQSGISGAAYPNIYEREVMLKQE